MKNDPVKGHSSHILNINPECKLRTVRRGVDTSRHIITTLLRSNGIIPLAGGQGEQYPETFNVGPGAGSFAVRSTPNYLPSPTPGSQTFHVSIPINYFLVPEVIAFGDTRAELRSVFRDDLEITTELLTA